ncbi:adaptor protein MecA [Salirhabdus salicampi]|uniref:adaptor protein MecA n=1 Tax=Salirhabdus salicampi TaxID=476102 RepID=UPI0020C20BD5|nr:adaptor protein MecA [Salirhabdus salicampi]MCP8615584.1 adaptor protein MecA [Salirhabdus salicampi]
MEIERINENTLKFYISYIDIEDRGFDRDEIWYNREKSEQLFWEMMDEVNEQEEFNVDGPLWIQVQAMDKGLEIVVTKAHLTKDGQKIELPTDDGKLIDMQVDEKVDSLLEQNLEEGLEDNDEEADEPQQFSFIIKFGDIEDVIQLSHAMIDSTDIENRLYHFENHYFLYVSFDGMLNDDEVEDVLSQLYEYGEDSHVTIHRLEEYGNEIFGENAINRIKEYFSKL